MQGDRLRAAQVEITGWEIQDIRDVNERLWSQFGSKVYHPNQTFHLNQAFILLNPNLAHELSYLGSGLTNGNKVFDPVGAVLGSREEKGEFMIEMFKSVFSLCV